MGALSKKETVRLSCRAGKPTFRPNVVAGSEIGLSKRPDTGPLAFGHEQVKASVASGQPSASAPVLPVALSLTRLLANIYRHIKSASALGRPSGWIGPWRWTAGDDWGHSHDRNYRTVIHKALLSVCGGPFLRDRRPLVRKTEQCVEELRVYVRQQETLRLARTQKCSVLGG